jgi:uncharacterized membrane protein YqhA
VETALWNSRFLVMLAVVPSLLGSLMLFIVGTLDILKVVGDVLHYYLVDDTHNPASFTRALIGQSEATCHRHCS